MKRLLLVAAAVLATSCTAQKVTAPVEDEPICSDFELGAAQTKHKGGLRKPVRVRILDGSSVESMRVLLGRRTADDQTAKLSIPDDDETYDVEWAQCENERAPRPLKAETKDARELAAYECGEAKVYATTKLEVRAGKSESRVIKFVAPPDAACWSSSGPPAAPTTSAAAEPSPDAGPPAEPTAPAAASASASAPAAATSAPKDATPAKAKSGGSPAPSKP